MCEPTTIAIASATMAATQSVVSFMGQRQQAQQMNAAFEENAANSLTAYSNDIEANNLSDLASQEQATQRRMEQQGNLLAARGSARAAGGAGGLSRDAIAQDLGFQAGTNISAIDRNQQLDAQRTRLSGRAARDTATSRINSAPRSNGPSLLALGADLGSAAVNGFTMNSQLQAQAAAGT